MKGKKTGGRQKGTLNKTTKELRLLVGKFIADNENEFIKRLKLLDDRTFCSLYIKMIQMNLPSLKSIFYSEFERDSGFDFSSWSDTELNEQINRFDK